MSLNGIMSSALSSLLTNSQALRVVSNNVANINTPGYARRTVNEQAQVAGGQLEGVDIASIQRVVDSFYTAETLSATSGSAQYDAQGSIFDQLNGLLGQPGDGTALDSQLDNVFQALGSATLDPSSNASRQGVLNAFQNLASTISTLSNEIGSLQSQTDQQVGASISSVNDLIKQIYNLNNQIETAQANGDTSTGLLDARDQAVQSLAQYMDVKTAQQPNGQLVVMTGDGINLVGDSYAQLSYAGGSSNGTYGQIMLQDTNAQTGAAIGSPVALDPHLSSGKLKGLIDMRDTQLGQLSQELGQFAQQTALAFNKVANASSTYPPPAELDGRDTGLVSGDALNFTGKTTIAVTDSSGDLVSRVDVDFDAGTMSVDGGPATSFTQTVGGFASALNTALGANGSADFTDGKLSIAANGGNGVVVQDDATTPSSRGGFGFSQFFGLNDIFTAQAPSITATGLSAGDDSGLAAGGQISLSLKGPNGDVAQTGSVTITAGMTIGDVVSALNTAMGGKAVFTLNSDGSLSVANASGYSNYRIDVTKDSTARGTTGMSFSVLFGLGTTQAEAQASSFSLTSAMSNANNLPFAQSAITGTTVAGDSVVTPGDARGLLALQDVTNTKVSFAAAGGFAARTETLNDYVNGFYQDVATRSSSSQTNQTTQDDRLTEAQSRQAETSGVNLDEELSNMMLYQQAYSAGARMLSTVQQLYDTLLQIPN